jgi:hypothetical protein
MFESALSDANFVLFALMCIVPIAIVTAMYRARRAEIVRLQNEVKQLSQSVKALEAAEQRRFIMELKSKNAGAEPALAASSAKVSAIPEGGKHQSTAAWLQYGSANIAKLPWLVRKPGFDAGSDSALGDERQHQRDDNSGKCAQRFERGDVCWCASERFSISSNIGSSGTVGGEPGLLHLLQEPLQHLARMRSVGVLQPIGRSAVKTMKGV